MAFPIAKSVEHLGERSLARVGNTPLLRLDRIGSEFPNVQLLARLSGTTPADR